MTERRSLAILFTGILIIAAASLGPSLMSEPMAEPDETLDELAQPVAGSAAPSAADPTEEDLPPALLESSRRSTATLEQMMVDPDSAIPAALLSRSQAVVVFPALSDDESTGRGQRGVGLLAARADSGKWSAPLYVSLSAAELGRTSGTEGTALILVLTDHPTLHSLLEGPLALGDGTPVASGPLGQNSKIRADDLAPVYSWCRSKGQFASIALDRALMAIDTVANDTIYGSDFEASTALDGQLEAPRAVEDFRRTLSERTPSPRS